MKIAIVNTQEPFVTGGAESLADGLDRQLTKLGHQVAHVRLPFREQPIDNIGKHMMGVRLLELQAGDPDLVIAFKFPAYLADAPRKKIWLLHQFRQMYELWDRDLAFDHTPEMHQIRQMVQNADAQAFAGAQEIFTISETIANRLAHYNNIKADAVLYPPLANEDMFYEGDQGDYFFYPSRLNPMKRQHLAIEALVHTRSNFRLVLAGDDPHGQYKADLLELIRKHNLHDRVEMVGWVSEQKKVDLMANAFAALFLAYQEDCYGLATLEGFASHKPVIALTDSGGTDEVINPGENGLIAEPTPESIAEAMENMWADKNKTKRMGQAAYQTIDDKGIRWPRVLERLVA